MAHDVFISYSSQNFDIAESVCDKLESNGIECWIAPRNIKTGSVFSEEIMDGLNAAKMVVLVFSKGAQESEYVNNEIATAFNNGKCIVAIKVDDTLPKDRLGFYLTSTQWLDASPTALEKDNTTLESCYDRLVLDVGRVLNGKPCPKGGFGGLIHDHEQSWFEKHKKSVLAAVLILIVAVGLVAFTSMNGNSDSADENETTLSIGYIGLEDNGGSYSYYVFGTLSDGFNSSSGDVIHIDYNDDSGKIVDSSDTKIGDIEGNILGSIDVSKKNVKNVSVELLDKNNKTLYEVESDNILEQ